MAVTRLKRKGLRNKARAKQRQEAIKKFTRLPPIKKVDIDAIKEEFAKNGKPSQPKKETSASPSADKSKPEEKTTSKTASAAEKKTEAAQSEVAPRRRPPKQLPRAIAHPTRKTLLRPPPRCANPPKAQ